MRHSRRTALAFLWLSASLAQAQPFPEKDLPPKLKAWVRWALDDAPAYGCALAGEAAVCLWPGRLQLDLSAAGGRFAQDAHADRASDLGLPGDAQRWPQDVRLDGAPAPVVDKDGVPSLRLPPGAHKVDGRFQWRQLPDSLPVPQPTAIVDLTLDGRRVPLPQREENGLLWIRKGGERETAAGDSLRLQVFRKLRDGIPLFLETSLRLEVSGKAREIELEGALVESAAAVAVRGDLPAQVEPNGRLRVQVRAGLFSVSLLARLEGAPKSVAAPRAPEPWPGSEIWVFEPDELLRQVQASGGNPVEPSRTDLPEDWRRFSAFGLEAGGALTLTELRRGEPEAPPDKLALQRELWLDLDGGAFTVRDRLTGTLSRTWRLDLLPPGQLGRAAVGGQDQLVTAGPELSSTGVELRAGTLDLTADSRLPRGGALPAVGWSANVESLGAQLHLPPGWRLIGGSGVDRLPHSWIGRWTLLGFFFVLLVAFGVGRLFGWRQGVVALLAVGLSYHERGAPFLSWLSLLGAVALLRAAPEGRLGKFARAWRALSLIVMAFVLLPFLRDQVREAIYPQVGRGTDVARDAGVLMDQVGGEVNAPPPPAASAPVQEASSELKALRRKGKFEETERGYAFARQAQYSNLAQDPHAVNQTGPGVPNWSWRASSLSWSGPVAHDHRLRLFLLSPRASLVLTLVRLGLLLALLALLLGWPKPRATAPAGEGPRAPAGPSDAVDPAAVSLAIWLALLPSMRLTAQEPEEPGPKTPSAALLEELKARLTRPEPCRPNCITTASLTLRIDGARLGFAAQVHAAAAAAWAVPGPTSSWTPDDVRVDGRPSAAVVRLDDGFLRVRLGAGVHTVEASGVLPRGDGLTLQLKDRPRRARVEAPGWDVVGLREDALSDESIQLSRRLTAGRAASAEGHYSPWLEVERALEIGVSWRVRTTVRRVSPVGSPVAVRVPLLPGEAPTEGGFEASDGAVAVALSRDQEQTGWSSTLAATGEIVLAAPEGRPWSEAWRVQCGVVWQCRTEGLAPVRHQRDGQYEPEFRPRPGEKLKLTFRRPQGAPGQTLTIDRLALDLRPGTRLEAAELTLQTRTSREELLALTLPPEADVQQVTVGGSSRPVRPEAGRLTLSLPAGAHAVAVQWHRKRGLGALYAGAPVGLSAPAVNAQISVTLPEDRWLLLTRGPAWGPAILFWGYLVVILAAALALGRLPSSPLRAAEWLLLALGLTQIPVAAAFVVVGFFFAVAWRRRTPPQRPWLFDLAQLGLVVWALAVLVCLYGIVERGLLLRPDMLVEGNGSSPTLLRWYVDRVASATPAVSVISLPIWTWRAAMLLWSLWLAASLVRWTGWTWRGFTDGGAWKPILKPRAKPPVQAPAGDRVAAKPPDQT